jgi:hypothetical protein
MIGAEDAHRAKELDIENARPQRAAGDLTVDSQILNVASEFLGTLDRTYDGGVF